MGKVGISFQRGSIVEGGVQPGLQPKNPKNPKTPGTLTHPQRSTVEGGAQPGLQPKGLGASTVAAQHQARRAVKGIAKLKVLRHEFTEQAEVLRQTDVV